MRNKRWHVTIVLLVCMTLLLVYARGKLVARETTFDASKVASGVYLYRLRVTQSGAPSYIESRKMVLIK